MIMAVVLSYFYFRYSSVDKVKVLLNDVNNLSSGKYVLKDGYLLNTNNEKVNDKQYINANGDIIVDKYSNVSFKIKYSVACISKTALGSIKFKIDECDEFKDIKVQMIKNNNTISYETSEPLSYKTSYKDDFKGIWVNQDNDQNIIINSYNEGKNYIWFKDSEGNISKAYTFEISCLDTSNASYDSSVFYCSGSTIIIDDIKWVVLKDNITSIKLMKYMPLDEKMHYTDSVDDFRWSTSAINNYLNNEFINTLSKETINKLLTIEICDDYSSYYCNDEICGGREKTEIERSNYTCNKYTTSKVKLISYDDFNYAYAMSKNKEFLSGNYLSLNSFEFGKVSSVLYNFDYYILESVTNKLDVRPVIIIDK